MKLTANEKQILINKYTRKVCSNCKQFDDSSNYCIFHDHFAQENIEVDCNDFNMIPLSKELTE